MSNSIDYKALMEEGREALRSRNVPFIGKMADLYRKIGCTHLEIWEFINNVEPITKADLDKILREWKDYPS